MGSFRASLELAGKTVDVLYSTYEFTRQVDKKGKPSSGVYGGEITFRIESTADSSIIEAMVNSQFKPVEGVITYKKTDEDASMRKVEFKNAYIIRFKETLDVTGESPMSCLVTVSAEEITIANATHFNRWPVA